MCHGVYRISYTIYHPVYRAVYHIPYHVSRSDINLIPVASCIHHQPLSNNSVLTPRVITWVWHDKVCNSNTLGQRRRRRHHQSLRHLGEDCSSIQEVWHSTWSRSINGRFPITISPLQIGCLDISAELIWSSCFQPLLADPRSHCCPTAHSSLWKTLYWVGRPSEGCSNSLPPILGHETTTKSTEE